MHAASAHTVMLRFQHHRHALWMQNVADRMGDLRRHLFLHLHPLGESLDHAGELGDADHAVGMSPYIASKHAVCGLVKTAALELGAAKIRVNAIAPGPIDNRMMGSLGDQLGGEAAAQFRKQVESSIALGRYGTNEEVANLALFLASDEASYCTGGCYLVDGGYVAA